MELSGPGRYRSLSARPSAAAYVDGEGTILASNEAFDALREELLNGRSAEPAVLPALFVPEDRESVRHILTAGRLRVCRSFRNAAPAEAATSLSAEFVRIMRKSLADVVWLVTLEQAVEAQGDTSELDVRAALTETIIEDLRIPLQEVLGWTSLLRRTRGDARRTEQALATIERNAELVIRLLEGLVQHARRQDTRTPPPHPAHRVELGEAPGIDASHDLTARGQPGRPASPHIRDSDAGVEIDHGRVVLIAALSFDVPIDKRREVMSTVTAVARSIRWSTGCLGCRLVSDCEAPSVFTLTCQWESQAHLDRYLASAEFQILKGTRFLLREGPTLSIDEVVSRGRESAGRHIK